MDVITFPENLQTTSGLSILVHDFISLPEATSYDELSYTRGIRKVLSMVLYLSNRFTNPMMCGIILKS